MHAYKLKSILEIWRVISTTFEQIIFLIVEILLVMAVLYISALIITGRKRLSSSYLASLFIIAVLAIFLLPIIRAIVSIF